MIYSKLSSKNLPATLNKINPLIVSPISSALTSCNDPCPSYFKTLRYQITGVLYNQIIINEWVLWTFFGINKWFFLRTDHLSSFAYIWCAIKNVSCLTTKNPFEKFIFLKTDSKMLEVIKHVILIFFKNDFINLWIAFLWEGQFNKRGFFLI